WPPRPADTGCGATATTGRYCSGCSAPNRRPSRFARPPRVVVRRGGAVHQMAPPGCPWGLTRWTMDTGPPPRRAGGRVGAGQDAQVAVRVLHRLAEGRDAGTAHHVPQLLDPIRANNDLAGSVP